MKKIYSSILMMIMALCLSVPCSSVAEAATVALLPLINNVENNAMANQVYYKEALNILKTKKGFVVVENDKLNAAIEVAFIGDDAPDKLTLAKIAKDGGVDIVFCMELDDLEVKTVRRNGERDVQLDMKGEFIAYNNITNNFYRHEFSSDKIVDASLITRVDWRNQEFGRQVRKEFNRALKVKK